MPGVVAYNKRITVKKKINAASTQEVLWNNYDNQNFYQTIAAEGLKGFAEKGGLASGCDLAQLKPYWSKAQSILEVGAGYGRVISYLLEQSFSGKITAIERCDVLFDHLQKNFSDNANVKLLHADIHNCEQITEKFDLILFLWSGFADFSQKEQPIIIKKLSTLLNKNAHLAIDTMPIETTPLNMKPFGKYSNYQFQIGNLTAYTYSASLEEIGEYASLSELIHIKHILYSTEASRKRYLHVLS